MLSGTSQVKTSARILPDHGTIPLEALADLFDRAVHDAEAAEGLVR